VRATRRSAACCLILFAGCAGARLASKPGAYAVTVRPVQTARRLIHATYVRPAQARHPGTLVFFATGDAGWFGASGAVFEHLAGAGYAIAGFSAPEVLRSIAGSGPRMSTAQAAVELKEVFAQAKRDLGLPDATPIVVVGFSRGASVVAFTAVHPELRGGVAGAIAIALSREADNLRAPEGEHAPELEVDKRGRIQLYPALKLLGSTRLAVIQSSNDSDVPAAESRQLLGPDTPTLRLYTVVARDHGFSDARDALLRSLDDALRWIEEAELTRPLF